MKSADLFPVVAATWPQRDAVEIGGFTVPNLDAGGNRVSATRLTDAHSQGFDGFEAAERAMENQDRAPLFQVLDHQKALEKSLLSRGYRSRDRTDFLLIGAADLAATPPPVTVFDIWPPLAIQAEIWDQGGIDTARRAVMARAKGAKTSIFGRIADQPAGSAYVAIHNDVAMLHALEIAPHLRRKGLAAIMMRAAADWASRNGASWLSVLVTQQNTGAQKLYASLSMKAVGSYHYMEKQEE